jgi:hypothetical protein
VPNELPIGYLSPAAGTSYEDPVFGSTVKTLARDAIHRYSLPSPFSAHRKYLLLTHFTSFFSFIADPVSGVTLYDRVPYSPQGTVWDAYDDNYYYYLQDAKIIRHSVNTSSNTVLIDYAQSPAYGFTRIETGGSSDASKDNFMAFWSAGKHQVCAVNLSDIKTYCADYRAANVVQRVGVDWIDFINVSKGIDAATGKRYVLLMATPAMGVWSVNTAADRLDFEYRGPEWNFGPAGNKDGICDPGEQCINAPHSDTFEDGFGRQYLLTVAQYGGFTANMPCGEDLVTMQLSDGRRMAVPSEAGGNMKTVMHMAYCGTMAWPDVHFGCARTTAACAIETFRDTLRQETDLLTPIPLEPYRDEILLMKGNGTAIQRLAHTRSVGFPSDNYWYQPRAAISPEGSIIVFDSNFGHPYKPRVNVIDGLRPRR